MPSKFRKTNKHLFIFKRETHTYTLTQSYMHIYIYVYECSAVVSYSKGIRRSGREKKKERKINSIIKAT